MKISKRKKYKTVNGDKVRIYAVDGGSPHSVHGAILINKFWAVRGWTLTGLFLDQSIPHHWDLVEIKPKK